MENYLKEISVFVYYGLTVNNRLKMKGSYQTSIIY